MRLEQITYFLRVAEHGNITAAAKSLYISQPALSKQITLLEQEIGLPLFERQARGVVLTQAGMQFQKDLQNILKELENAKKNAVLAVSLVCIAILEIPVIDKVSAGRIA